MSMQRGKTTLAIASLIALAGSPSIGVPAAAASAAGARTAPGGYSGTITLTKGGGRLDGFGGAGNDTFDDKQVEQVLCAGLLGQDERGRYYPDIAAAVPTLANGGVQVVRGNTVVTVHRRRGLRWSDGSPITDADWVAPVVLNYTRAVHGAAPSEPLEAVAVSGDAVVYTFTGLYAPALAYLTLFGSDMAVDPNPPLPVEYLERKYGVRVSPTVLAGWSRATETDPQTGLLPAGVDASSGLGALAAAYMTDYYTSPADVWSGPYKVGAWAPDQRYTLVPNPYYTLHAGQPHPRPAQIQLVVVSSARAPLAQALATDAVYNGIDEAEGLTLADVPAVRQSRYRPVVQPELATVELHLNLGQPALRDPRVRQALDAALDMPGVLQALFPSLDGATLRRLARGAPFFPVASPYADPALPITRHDPARARALLARAGYGARHLHLVLWTVADPTVERLVELLQREWAQVGIDVGLRFAAPLGQDGLFSPYGRNGILSQGRYDLAVYGHSAQFEPDLAPYVDPGEIPGPAIPRGLNVGRIDDPRLLALARQARATLDPARRAALYRALQAYLVRQDYSILLYSRPEVIAVKPTLGNFRPGVTGFHYWNAWQWYRAAEAP